MWERIDVSKQFVIFLLEEPESHLHFPLQAMTIRKIINKQFIITTHSPQVVLEFNPYSIIRLYFDKNKKTKIAKNGCSEEVQDEVIDFGYRYNLITGSMFFSSGVFLVEGTSELLLFKFLAKKVSFFVLLFLKSLTNTFLVPAFNNNIFFIAPTYSFLSIHPLPIFLSPKHTLHLL